MNTMRLRFKKRFYTKQVDVQNLLDFNDELFNLISVDCQVDLTYDTSIKLDDEGMQEINYIPIDCEAVVTQWVNMEDVNTTQGLKLLNLKFERLEQDGDVLLIKRQTLGVNNISFINETKELTPDFVILNFEESKATICL